MRNAEAGDTVRLHCTVWDEKGTILENSEDTGPLEVNLGSGQIPHRIEQALMDMRPGERLMTSFGPFGDRQAELVHSIERDRLPDGVPPEVGAQLPIHYPDGEARMARITGVGESCVTVDANPELAGKQLMFEIRLVEVV